MTDYQGFPISNFRTGFTEALEPWLMPRDAFQLMKNAHLYRGVLEKIDGYNLFAIMTSGNTMELQTPDGVRQTFTGTLTSMPVSSVFYGYGTISVAAGEAEVFSYVSDDGVTITLKGDNGGTGFITISTLFVSLTFGAIPPAGAYSRVFFSWFSGSTARPIMGIKQYYTNKGGQEVIVFDTARAGKIVINMGYFQAQQKCSQTVQEIPHPYYKAAVITASGVGPYTGTLGQNYTVPGTVTFTQYTSAGQQVTTNVNGLTVPLSITDNGRGGLVYAGYSGVIGSVDYVSGNWTITFPSAPTAGNTFSSSAGSYGDFFTGSFSNFFTVANYQYSLFVTNSVDLICYYDGISFEYLNTLLSVKPITASSGRPDNLDITACLHLVVYRDRLLLLSPTVESVQQVSAVFWSKNSNPFDFTNDEQEYAPTSQPIRAFFQIGTSLIVRFANSERILTYTGDAFAPFRWDATNNLWACDAPYSAINYDSWASTVGRPAIVSSDGVNIKRADQLIPDFTDPSRVIDMTPVPYINQTSIKQCYGERFDDLKEGWLCYNSSTVNNTITPSDNILAYNYMDETYAVYTFPFSCLGLGTIINVPTWGTIQDKWGALNVTWSSYQLANNALIDLGGDQFGKVYELNEGTTLGGDLTKPVLLDVITKNFNPFIDDGQFARLGYLDLFVTADNSATMRVQFFVNDNMYVDGNGVIQGWYKEEKLTFTTTDAMSPTLGQTKVWKRIYVGAVGREHTIRFYQHIDDFANTTDQYIYIHAMVPYMKPAGRIFN